MGDQILTRDYVNESLQIELSQEQYDNLAIIDLTAHKSIVFSILQTLKELKIL